MFLLSMKKEKKEKHFIEKPIYPGGIKAMREFIRKNMKYPEEALKNKIEGSVYCRYNLNYKGKVTSVKILTGLGYGCDEEAKRLIKSLEFTPSKSPRRLRVGFQKTLRIHFKLPKKIVQQKTPPSNTKVTYQITYKSDPRPTSPKKKDTYHYTIKY